MLRVLRRPLGGAYRVPLRPSRGAVVYTVRGTASEAPGRTPSAPTMRLKEVAHARPSRLSPNEWTHQTHEQRKLLHDLRKKGRNEPGTSAAAMLHWYMERVKESRTRLAQNSAESEEAIAYLMQYAARRRDVATLRRLRAPAQAWTQQHVQRAALFSESTGSHTADPLLLTRLDNTLFSLAAQQNNWTVMHMLASSRRDERWTPFMCRALLRTEGALDMVHGTTPTSTTTDLDTVDAHTRHELWSMFLDEFGHAIRRSQQSQPPNASPYTPLPPWVTVALMELYSRSGRAMQAVAMMNMYLSVQSLSGPTPSPSAPRTLIRAPSHLLTSPNAVIPGPMLLNSLLLSFLRIRAPKCAMEVFGAMTRTPIEILAPEQLLPPLDTRFILEPDTNSVLIMMDALAMAASHEKGAALLGLLQQVERTWGVLASGVAQPLLYDHRPFIKLLQYCMDTDDRVLARRALRYQRGAMQRTLQWYKQAAMPIHDFHERPNTETLRRRWEASLARLQNRAWIKKAHADALRGFAKQLAAAHRTSPKRPRNALHTPS